MKQRLKVGLEELIMNNKQEISSYIKKNKEHLELLVEHHVLTRDQLLFSQEVLFHNDINNEFEDLIRWTVAKEVSKDMALSVEDCLIVLEELNVKKLFKDLF